jgi:hypothetical protein
MTKKLGSLNKEFIKNLRKEKRNYRKSLLITPWDKEFSNGKKGTFHVNKENDFKFCLHLRVKRK